METITYDPRGQHFALYPTDDPKIWVVWNNRDKSNGHEMFVGPFRDCVARIKEAKR